MSDEADNLKDLKDEDYFKLWMYFEDRADKIKAEMFSMFTWLSGLKTALLSFIFANLVNYDCAKAKLPLSVIVISATCTGLTLCLYSFFMISESGKHIDRNWKRADKFKTYILSLNSILEEIKLESDKSKRKKNAIWKFWKSFRTLVIGAKSKNKEKAKPKNKEKKICQFLGLALNNPILIVLVWRFLNCFRWENHI